MNRLQITLRYRIREGKLNEFKKLATESLAISKEKDKNTRQCDWFFTEDYNECIVRELYVNSNGVIEHLDNLGDVFDKIMETADCSVYVFGDPTNQLKERLAPMNVKYYIFYQGF